MAGILLKENDNILLKGEVSELTPMGVACEVELEDMDLLRSDSGKYKVLDIEVQISQPSGMTKICGGGNVYAVRRVSQQRCSVTIRFTSLEQNGYRLISEHISPNPVVCINEARNARQIKTA